jgi:hypothetical protein
VGINSRPFAKLCDLRDPVTNLLNCAEDHRRGALDRPAHEVPGAVAVLYLGERFSAGTISPSGLVVMSQ